jgi:acyl-CoA reductase-like NAD-dependent aldehyde dehydrogenase
VAFKSINPHNPSEIIGEFEDAGLYDVEIAVGRAREAFFEWREQPAPARGGALANIADDVEKWAEELVRFTVMEVGKPIGDTRASALKALERSAGSILAGAESLDREGFYLELTLVEVADPTNPFTQEEILVPVAALLKAASAEEAVQIANGVRQGIVAAVYTNDLDRAMEYAKRLEAGLVRVNSATVSVDCHVPFGGSKDSGTGYKGQGLAARDFYTETRTILISP